MSKTIEARIIEIEHPGGRVDYQGQLNYKRTVFGIPLWNNWVNVTGRWSTKEYTKKCLQRKISSWEYRNNKKKRVVEEF